MHVDEVARPECSDILSKPTGVAKTRTSKRVLMNTELLEPL